MEVHLPNHSASLPVSVIEAAYAKLLIESEPHGARQFDATPVPAYRGSAGFLGEGFASFILSRDFCGKRNRYTVASSSIRNYREYAWQFWWHGNSIGGEQEKLHREGH
jgi:hypothetical protein